MMTLPLPTAHPTVKPTTTMPTPPTPATPATPATTALIVIDVQNALFNPAPRPFEADLVIERINRLTAAARAAGVPVVWVQHERENPALAHGSPGWALPDALRTDAGDARFRKTTPDAFLRTGLGDWLAARGIQQLVICGYASEYCIDTSTRRAAGLGFAVTLAADAHTTHDKPHASGAQIRAHHNATLPDLTSFGVPIRALPSAEIHFAPDPAAAPLPHPLRHQVRNLADLAALYGQPSETSLRKESPVLTPAYRAMLAASPLVVLASSGPGGLDASPRGDPGSALVVQDERTLLLPDRRGNQRLDSLRNLVDDPRVALLCLIPGRNETLRINGRAALSTDPALRQRLAMDGKLPISVLVIHIEVVYFQCSRALQRAQLWNPAAWPDLGQQPTAGQLLASGSGHGFTTPFDGAAYDAALPLRQRDSLY